MNGCECGNHSLGDEASSSMSSIVQPLMLYGEIEDLLGLIIRTGSFNRLTCAFIFFIFFCVREETN